MKKSAKIAIGAVAVTALAAIMVVRFIGPKKQSEVVPPPVVKVEHPQIGTIELSVRLIGQIEPSDMVTMIPKMAGEVTEVFVKEGDQVTEGQLLCKIDTKQVESAKLSLDAAAIALNDAKTNLSRMQVLYSSGGIAAQALEQVQSGVKSAQIQYDGAKLAYDMQIENSNITAPIAGVVESVNMEVHGMVSPQSPICVISGEGGKTITFAVPERVAMQLSAGDEVRVEKNETEYVGTVTQASTMVDPATGLFKMKASVKDGAALITGTMAQLYVTSAKAENVVTLPVDAIYYENGSGFVYTYDNETVHKVPVTTGINDEKRIEIISGVTEKDQVITTWSPELYEGAPVILEDEPEKAGTEATKGEAAGGEGTEKEAAGTEVTKGEAAGTEATKAEATEIEAAQPQ